MNVLLQAGDNKQTALSLLVRPHHNAYVAFNGAEYQFVSFEPSLESMWLKFKAIHQTLSCMASGDFLVWLDLDAVVLKSKFRVDIFDFFNEQDFEIAAQQVNAWHVGAPVLVNAGVLFIRNTENVQKVVKNILDTKKPSSWDETELAARINKGELKFTPLPLKYNSWKSYQDADPIIQAWHSVDKRVALAEMLKCM